MRAWAIMAVALSLSACAQPHEFTISSDEPIKGVDLVLANMRKSKVDLKDPNFVQADVWAADSGGKIAVQLASGKYVTCEVGYMTSGDVEPHIFMIEGEQCVEGIQE